MSCASALSTLPDSGAAARDAIGRTASAMGDGDADLAVIFATMHHAEALPKVAALVRESRLGRHVLACTAESVLGDGREIEDAPALCVWSIRLHGVTLTPRRLSFEDGVFTGMAADPRSSLLLLGDPFSFPADRFLKLANDDHRGLRVFGGMASGGRSPGLNRLVLDGDVHEDGAVAIELAGPVALRTIVSQGCRPIGRPYVVTRVEGNVIRELGRRPALEVFRELYGELDADDRERVQQGLHIGRVINEYQESFRRGDFLVRNVIGADDAGGIAITDVVRVGQTVQFHVRDEATADEDLRSLLEQDRAERPGSRVRGALLFTCNGRGSRLFSGPNHDVGLVREVLGPVPVAGFFAMGELGPVGGQNFVHGYTASVVVFEEPDSTASDSSG